MSQEITTREVDQVVFPPVAAPKFIVTCYNEYISILNLDIICMDEYTIKLPKNIIPVDYIFKEGKDGKKSFFKASIQNVRFIHHQTKNNYIMQKVLLLVEKDDERYIIMKNTDYKNGDEDDYEEEDKMFYFQTLVLERTNKYKILL